MLDFDTDLDVARAFAQLFEGNGEAYGAGGSAPACIKERPTVDVVKRHLLGERPIGIYPIGDDGNVRWTCIDIDYDDIGLAKKLKASIYHAVGLTAWVERSRSKGYHVWTFIDGCIPARVARAAMHTICNRVGYDPKEVNPKQDALEPGSFGNYVRLPYPGGLLGGLLHTTNRQIMLDEFGVVPLRDFVEIAWGNLLNEGVGQGWDELAAQWKPAPKRRVATDLPTISSDEVAAFLGSLPKLIRTIVVDGPKPGHDRSNSLVRLARKMQESGVSVRDAALALVIADSRWGKFSDRPDGEDRIMDILSLAYGED